MKETGSNLIAALDPYDGAGILDSYFPEADFFTEFERFDRHVDKLRRKEVGIDYVSVCSPNFLHDSHIRFGLRTGADVICEKPIVLNPWNVDALSEIEHETGKNIYNILQLRLHPSVIELKNKIENGPNDKIYDIDLSYITARGHWYYTSWKGDIAKSGGVASNIGVHFFDMLIWIFGEVQSNIVHLHEHDRAAGFLQLKKARVRWFLSINYQTIPDEIKKRGLRTFRSITVDGDTFEFSDGFTELHTRSYENILSGKGFRISETAKVIETVYTIRNSSPVGIKGDYHPLAKLPLSKHPILRNS
ncbi:MAG: Gfo/Idh/MocA family oxidoreductase [Mariniphaga sp.]|nr:Gfo/Idh/MocA family oxidoreductase [Mariniphaga sp.]